jgi:molybdopterin/thiamine biosynthesis adenylyltransferase
MKKYALPAASARKCVPNTRSGYGAFPLQRAGEHKNMNGLTNQDQARYSRQLVIPQWGEEAQRKLKQAIVFVAGAGGLGSPVIMYLAAAGVGRLRVCDDKEIERSNLNRQVLYSEKDVRKRKVMVAKHRVKALNRSVRFEAIFERIQKWNVRDLVADSDLILDCLDNFKTRFILNEFAVKMGVPLIHAGVRGYSGQVSLIHSPFTPCLSCIVGNDVPSAGEFPILGATAGIVGSLQALEALKYLTGIGGLLKGRILFFNGAQNRFHISREQKRKDCRVCGRLNS